LINYKKIFTMIIVCVAVFGVVLPGSAFFRNRFRLLEPENGNLYIPVGEVSNGRAHYFKVKAFDGVMVTFFVVKSRDGIIRAAIDACDVCYKSGKGYIQQDDVMVCTNCGRKFATDKINEVNGGCNPAPLARKLDNDTLVISMKDINANSWYCKYKR